jgi:hypothetical protein
MRSLLSFVVLVLTLVSPGCVTQRRVDPPSNPGTPKPQFIHEDDPTRAPGYEGLSQTEIRGRLTMQKSMAAIYQGKVAGELKYFGGLASVSASSGSYTYISDYGWYDAADKERRVGVAVRISADITTRDANIQIGDLFALAAKVSAGRASGTLTVSVIGLRGDDIVLPPPAPTIDLTAVQQAYTAQRDIINKLANADTVFDPHVLAKPPTAQSSGARPQGAGDPIGAGSFSYSGKPGGTYPGATAIEEKDTILHHVAQRFNTVFARVPVVVTSVTGQNLKGGERFEVHPRNITPEGFDIELQVWKAGTTPDIVTVSWIAFDKENLGGLAARLSPDATATVERRLAALEGRARAVDIALDLVGNAAAPRSGSPKFAEYMETVRTEAVKRLDAEQKP